MVAPFTVDTVWQIVAWVVWQLLWVGLGLSFVYWQMIEYIKKIPALWPPRLFYYFGWILTAVAWGAASFLMWWTPTAAVPAAAGTWDVWFIPLIVAIFLAPVAALFHLLFWRYRLLMVGWWILLIVLLINIAVFLLFFLAVGGTPVDFVLPCWAAFISLVGLLWLLYLLIVVWQLTRCTPEGPCHVDSCSPHRTTCPAEQRLPLMTPRECLVDQFYPVKQSTATQIGVPIAGTGAAVMHGMRCDPQHVL